MMADGGQEEGAPGSSSPAASGAAPKVVLEGACRRLLRAGGVEVRGAASPPSKRPRVDAEVRETPGAAVVVPREPGGREVSPTEAARLRGLEAAQLRHAWDAAFGERMSRLRSGAAAADQETCQETARLRFRMWLYPWTRERSGEDDGEVGSAGPDLEVVGAAVSLAESGGTQGCRAVGVQQGAHPPTIFI